MKDLHRLLHALNRVTAVLLATRDEDNLEASILQGMEVVGRCVNSDRVLMWRNETIGGELFYVQQQQWISAISREHTGIPLGAKFAYRDTPNWVSKFLRGECINSPLSQLPPDDQALLGPFGIKSVAIIPLFLEDQFWGFLSLDNCVNERVFTDEEISVLRSAGLLFASALLHHRMLVNMSAREALERFEVVWANVECGIAIVDAETRDILDVNPVTIRMFGGNRSDIVGHRCNTSFCPAEAHSCPILDKNQMVDRSERKFKRADGTIIPIVKSVAKIMLNGRLALLESFTDISNLKEAEKQLLQMQVTEQANKAKSLFLSTMSHEMRTPLNAIIGMTAIGRSTGDLTQKNRALDKIDDASRHLLGIINDVLDMSKIEAGKFELSPAEFSFEKMLQRVVNVVSFRAGDKRQRFTVSSDPNIPPVMHGDDQRLAQIITNLLGNAVKFTPEGGSVRLSARLVCEDCGECSIRFEVTDSGIGISVEQQSRLFQSFQQADGNTSRKFGGTGLGLSISKNIVEMMGGTITVESELGKGATFAFTIPMKRGDAQAYEQLVRETESGVEDSVNFEGRRILLAEDVEINREIVLSLLESTRLGIDCAANGAEAVRMFQADPERYDAILMDVQMPEMDGYEATRLIRATSAARAADIPIIAMTANVFREDIEKCLAAGMNDHLGKPIDIHDVQEKLRQYFEVPVRC